MRSTGPFSPGSVSNKTGLGSFAWSNPSNAMASDDVRATVALPDGFGNESQWLWASDFGFSIPSGAPILGVKAEVERSTTAGTGMFSPSVQLTRGTGSPQGTNKGGTGDVWPVNIDTYAVYGGEADLWGLALVPGDVNSPTFGVAIRASTFDFAGDARVDHIRMTVYYQSGPMMMI